MPTLITFCAGALSWSASEYLLHRFAGHAPRAGQRKGKPGLFDGDFGSEHQAHHRDTRYFTPTPRKVRTAGVALTAMGGLGSLIFGPASALSFTVGYGLAYASYEIVHRRIHTHPPGGAYSRWTRRHHLAHHFKSPQKNHGVTSGLWDHLFKTHMDPGVIRVPERHAPSWLLDPISGDVKPEYRDDYVLVRTGRPAATPPKSRSETPLPHE